MRTTIEIPDHQRAKLLEIAARRGLKGFSAIVQEAVGRYLEKSEPHDAKVGAALSVLGTLSEKEGEALEAAAKRLRATWR